MTLELTSLMLGAYSFLVPDVFMNIVNSVSSTTAFSAVVVSIIGGIRQRKFDMQQILSLEYSQLIGDRDFTVNFEINGQRGPWRRLKNIVENEKDPNVPITVLVDGKWGDGKTYLVNDVVKNLMKSNKDYVVVRFEPWRHVSEEAIVTSFYNSLGNELKKLPGSTGIQFDIAALSRNFVSKIDKTGTIESVLTQFPQPSSSVGLKKAERLLKDTGKRLVFIIDDVERCGDQSRTLRTLQLGLHLGSDITNTTTIIIGDIQEIIKKTKIEQTFLQKIIDEQITVLPPTSEEMLKITNILMKKLPVEIRITQDQRLDLLMRNVRGVKRVLNGLNQDFLGVGSNIHPQDIFAINVIRHSFPTVYADIMQSRAFYVPFQYKNYADEEFLLYGFDAEEKESNFIIDQAKHLSDLMEKLELNDIYKRRLISVLEELFPATKGRFENGLDSNNNNYQRQHRRERRIGVSRDYIDRYFLLSEDVDKRHIIEDSQAKIRDDYFKEMNDETRLQSLNSLVDLRDESSEEVFYGGLADILADLPGDNPNRKILSRDMLRLYFRNTNFLVRDDKRTLLTVLDAINNYVDRNDYVYVFEDIWDYMSHPSTGLRLLLYINPTRHNNFYDLKSYVGYDSLRKKILSKIDEYYIIQKHDILEEDNTDDQEWRFTIAQWSTSVCYDKLEDLIDSRRNKVNDYIIGITQKSPKKFHDLLMGAFWHRDINDNKNKFNFRISPQPYDVKKFALQARKLIKQNGIDSNILSDLNAFLESYKKFKKEDK